jgi:hypothetical protein
MSKELVHDNSQWKHKKEGFTVTVEHSAPLGVTTYRRDVGVPYREGSTTLVRTLRSKKTHYFLDDFEKV